MAHIGIRRLIVDAPGLTEGQGRRLAELIGEGLAGHSATSAPSTLRVELSGDLDSTHLERLARRVVADLLRQLR